MVRQVGEGLAALHQRGVLHRDIKPANVLFRTVDPEHDGTLVRAMVGDLGLGKALDVSSRLTMIAGTPSFVAPEQAQGEHLDARADQYSLAALAYLLLCGRPPYAHGTLSAAANPAPPAPMSTPERPFPPAVEDVVRRGLAVDRDERYPDVPAFVEALRAALGPEAAGELPARWLPVDPDLTQPGNRPSLVPGSEDLPAPVAPRRSPPLAGSRPGVVLLVAGAVAGLRRLAPHARGRDRRGRSWGPVGDRARRLEPRGVTPGLDAARQHDRRAGAVGGRRRHLGVGRRTGRACSPDCSPRTSCRRRCHSTRGATASGKARRSTSGEPSVTVVSTGCPGVIIEQATQVSATKLLWVQVRGDDLSTAQDVLDSVRTHGAL